MVSLACLFCCVSCGAASRAVSESQSRRSGDLARPVHFYGTSEGSNMLCSIMMQYMYPADFCLVLCDSCQASGRYVGHILGPS